MTTAPLSPPGTHRPHPHRTVEDGREKLRQVAPGLTLAVLVALAATELGGFVPVIGAPVFGIVLGLLLAAAITPHSGLTAGFDFAAKPVLQTSIVVLGATLSLRQVAIVGLSSLPVMLGTLAVALLGAFVLGRVLGVRGDAQLLIGVGTGICGASAIAAVTAVLKPRQTQVAYAIGTIFMFNVAAVLLFPVLGHAWHLSAHSFGLWAGTAVNDTSSVVAAAYSFSTAAGPYALVVKLTRTLTLIPIVLILGIWHTRRAARATTSADAVTGPARLPWRKIVPLFLFGFLATSALDTIGVIPSGWQPSITHAGTFLITVALSGIGLSLRWNNIRSAGVRPLLLGGCLWVLVTASSLGLQALTHTL
ncbi:MAG TPA: putative sulfate exporter family transporter [Pseudonocardiaceae bacterium]|jgi:uncharacterized integral membrane protein (TIGR00698 family)|nr:putative sulfate exporter family transporter [Pseudonocardiaceae bacterium]